jgi:hypothetical protein
MSTSGLTFQALDRKSNRFLTEAVQNSHQNKVFLHTSVTFTLLAMLLVLPLALSNSSGGAVLGILFFVLLFFLPGYLLLALIGKLPNRLHALLSLIFGMAVITTAFDLFARASMSTSFFYLVAVLSAGGIIAIVLRNRFQPASRPSSAERDDTLLAGCIVALAIAPFLWRSGRFSGHEFVFYGPAGKDPLFHVTLLQRLLLHIPPDNFIMAGLRAPVYHYFDDLALAFTLSAQHAWHLPVTNLFDVYFRCYPVVLYFLLGALGYRVGKQLAGTKRGGILGVVLLLGGGGLGWSLGALQSLAHARHFTAFRASLFSSWTSWDGVDSILPLVHRPAHYNGLLLSLAAITILLQSGASRRNWAVAGLLLGLMSGFNFTLAATFGGMAVLGALMFALARRQREAADLFWLALFLFIGSLPVLSSMLLSGFHNNAPGFPFRGPNLEFPAAVWGPQLSHLLPARLVPWAALIVLPIFAYGFRLFGFRAMAHLDLGERSRRSVAMLLALVFSVSFVIGIFFPYNAFAGEAIIFIQPSIWILALFSIRPLDAWLTRHGKTWATAAVWGVLGLTWLQALASFNFSQRAEFSQEAMRAFEDIHTSANHEDVIAYLPDGLTELPILGTSSQTTNFAIMAMTGLDGYFSSEPYSTSFAVPGLRGATPADIVAQARQLYDQRLADVNSFVSGDVTDASRARLANDHVRWIVISGEALRRISSSVTPWRKTGEIVIYHLSQ